MQHLHWCLGGIYPRGNESADREPSIPGSWYQAAEAILKILNPEIPIFPWRGTPWESSTHGWECVGLLKTFRLVPMKPLESRSFVTGRKAKSIFPPRSVNSIYIWRTSAHLEDPRYRNWHLPIYRKISSNRSIVYVNACCNSVYKYRCIKMQTFRNHTCMYNCHAHLNKSDLRQWCATSYYGGPFIHRIYAIRCDTD
jgi:hypothetical protein